MAVSVLSAYVIYQTIYIFRAVLAASLGGLLLGSLLWSKKFKASAPKVVLAGLAGYLVFGILGFVKFQGVQPMEIITEVIFKQLFYAPIYSWKQLATLDIPVGSFSTTLAPYFLLIFIATFACTYMYKRGKSLVVIDILCSFGMMIFGFLFGFKEHSATVVLFGIYFPRLRDLCIGALWLVGTILWLNLRSRKRVGAVVVDKVVGDGAKSGAVNQRIKSTLLAGVVLVAAFTLTFYLAAPFAGNDNKNLRQNPLEQNPPQTSPLDNFRSYFKGGDDGFLDKPLLRVEGDIPENKRLRFAALPFYDGVKSLSNNSGDAAVDVYHQLVYKFNHFDANHTSEITNLGYSTPWLPTLGIPVNVEFQGNESLKLQQSLFFNTNTSSVFLDEAGVKIDTRNNYTNAINFPDSAKYKILWHDRWDNADTEVSDPGVSKYTSKEITPNLYQWILDRNDLAPGNTIADVRKLVDEMMYYSYLSRSLDDPGENTNTKTWLPRPDYVFAASYSGQSIKRIDTDFFGELNKTSAECVRDDPSSNCGLLLGDEQQFATAAMLIADMKGFDTRVVVGANIEDDGVVYGRDLTVWTEVKNSIQNNWARIYVDPRTDNHVPTQAPQPKLNSYTTDVEYPPTQTPELSVPKAQSGARSNASARASETVQAAFNFIYVWRGMFGAVLGLVLLLPALTILLAKRARRRARRSIFNAESQIAAGWRELQDFMADRGVPYPAKGMSRTKYAAELGGGEVLDLAHIADRAVFGEVSPSDTVIKGFWQSLDRVFDDKMRTENRFKRILSALNPKSLLRRRR